MRSRYRITDQDGIYFVTSTIVEWLPVFTNQPYFDILINTFAKFEPVENCLTEYYPAI